MIQHSDLVDYIIVYALENENPVFYIYLQSKLRTLFNPKQYYNIKREMSFGCSKWWRTNICTNHCFDAQYEREQQNGSEQREKNENGRRNIEKSREFNIVKSSLLSSKIALKWYECARMYIKLDVTEVLGCYIFPAEKL